MIGRLRERRRFIRDHRWSGAHMSEYIDGELNRGETHRLEAHTSACPECEQVLATLRRTVAALRGLGNRSERSVAGSVLEGFRRRV